MPREGIDVLPARVRQAREEAGLSLSQLADGTVSRTFIHFIETGKARPSRSLLEAISRRTGRPVEFFVVSNQKALTEGSALAQEGTSESRSRGRTSAAGRAPTASRRGSRTRQRSRTLEGAAASLVNNLNQVISENAALKEENELLKAMMTRIAELAAEAIGGHVRAATATERTSPHRANRAAQGRRRRTQVRKPITDPEALERRRQALAKARAVRAERLAQRKAG
jgi:transcriptional regulator with XRE-family HTH domain